MVTIQTTLFIKIGNKLIYNKLVRKQVVEYDGNWVRGLK